MHKMTKKHSPLVHNSNYSLLFSATQQYFRNASSIKRDKNSPRNNEATLHNRNVLSYARL